MHAAGMAAQLLVHGVALEDTYALPGAEQGEQSLLISGTKGEGVEVDQRRLAGGDQALQGVADLVQDGQGIAVVGRGADPRPDAHGDAG